MPKLATLIDAMVEPNETAKTKAEKLAFLSSTKQSIKMLNDKNILNMMYDEPYDEAIRLIEKAHETVITMPD